MARYFLHFQDGERFILDEDGADFADLPAAEAEALKVLQEVLAAKLSAAQGVDSTSIVIANATGHVLDTVPLRLAMILNDKSQDAKTSARNKLELITND